MAQKIKFKNLCGGKLRMYRRNAAKRMSQEELVQKLFNMGIEMDRTALSRIENQQRSISDIEFFGICYALRISPAVLTASPELHLYFQRLHPEAETLVAETPQPPFGK